MAKTKKQIIEDLKLIDVVIEILDARIPRASQNKDLQELFKNKKRIILLNKSDLAEEAISKKWLEFYKKQDIPAISTNLNNSNEISKVLQEVQKIAQEEKQAMAEKGRVGKAIRVMVVGIPNVGKSSFINRITKKTVAMVGNKPGVTKQKQWVKIKENIELLDTPGMLWPKLEPQEIALHLAFVGTIKDDNLEKVEVAYYLLKYLLENKRKNIIDRYNLDEEEIENILNNTNQPENENILEIFNIIGRKRGALVTGGQVDEEKVASLLLEEFRSGKLGRITLEKP